MTDPQTLQRLERLESYLLQDSDNLALLADTFDAAMQAADWQRAEFHLRHGQALNQDRPAWDLREVRWLFAQQRWADAGPLIRKLQSAPDLPAALQPVLAHDSAYASLRLDDLASARAALAPWVEAAAPENAIDGALQLTWVRVLHRLPALDEGMAWAKARWSASTLAPGAAGAASLLALDAGDYTSSRTWAEFALRQDGMQMEALVARASIALAELDATKARHLLSAALRHNPKDGRAWSALGFTDLLEQKVDTARADFERALQHMPSHIGTWHGLGWTAVLQKDFAAAQKAFEAALAIDRNFAESHGGLAVTLAMQSKRREAEAAIALAERLDRGNISARYAQALLQGDASDAQSLQRLARRLLAGRAAPLGGTMADMLPGGEPDKTPDSH